MKTANVSGRLFAVLTVLAAVSASACGGSTTTFASSWRSPTAEPMDMQGKKVAAVVMMENSPTRRNAEDVLAREISHYGPIGVAMYTVMQDSSPRNEAAARAAIEREHIEGVVVMRPRGVKQKTETHEVYSDPYYSGYWGGYYGYGWGNSWGAGYAGYNGYGVPMGARRTSYGPPVVPGMAEPYYGGTTETHTETIEVIQVEILIYSLKQNQLVWAGMSETTEAEKVDTFVTQLAAATAKELGEVGLRTH